MGFDLNLQEPSTGFTILHYAIMFNLECLIRTLLGYELNEDNNTYKAKSKPLVNLNVTDKEGRTALHLAIKSSELGTFQNSQILNLLLTMKADPKIKDKKGLTCFDYAASNKVASEALKEFWPALVNAAKPQKEKKQMMMMNGYEVNGVKVDYLEDAELYFKQHVEKLKNDKMSIDKIKNEKPKPEVEVDKVSEL
jgi:hypothetical protein